MTDAPTTQRTLVLVKPDGVRRGLSGEILRRIEAKGYTLVAVELREAVRRRCSPSTTPSTRASRSSTPLIEFMRSGPVLAVVAEGHRAIEGFRSLAGATDPTVAAPGTIRGDLGRDWGLKVIQNLVHGSDSAGVGRARDRPLVPRALTPSAPEPYRRRVAVHRSVRAARTV